MKASQFFAVILRRLGFKSAADLDRHFNAILAVGTEGADCQIAAGFEGVTWKTSCGLVPPASFNLHMRLRMKLDEMSSLAKHHTGPAAVSQILSSASKPTEIARLAASTDPNEQRIGRAATRLRRLSRIAAASGRHVFRADLNNMSAHRLIEAEGEAARYD